MRSIRLAPTTREIQSKTLVVSRSLSRLVTSEGWKLGPERLLPLRSDGLLDAHILYDELQIEPGDWIEVCLDAQGQVNEIIVHTPSPRPQPEPPPPVPHSRANPPSPLPPMPQGERVEVEARRVIQVWKETEEKASVK